MVYHWLLSAILSAILAVAMTGASMAQQPQIPTLQVCNQTSVSGKGEVVIDSRSAPSVGISGKFQVGLELVCEPPSHPSGTVLVVMNMIDTTISSFSAVTVDQVTTTGKHTPIAFVQGRCLSKSSSGNEREDGCRYWLMVADNGRNSETTPDIVSFLVMDGNGRRIAHGAGPLVRGDLDVVENTY